MTLTIHVTPDLEARLRDEASRVGAPPEQFVMDVLRARLTASRNSALIDLIRSWRQQDATDDPAELEARQRLFEQTKAALDANRDGERKLFP